jgi:hypothetical protein
MATVGDHRFVFVGGLHRSGTSIVTKCLAQHPEVSSFTGTGVPEDEGQFLQSVYPVGGAHGGPGRFAFDPAAHLTEASPLATAASAAQLFEEWSSHWDLDRQILLEKSPPNVVRARFLQALFPGASFVMVMRHPVAVAMAVKRRRPKRTRVLDMVRHWVVAHELLERDLPALERVVVVPFESFVAEPARWFDHLQRFLGLVPVANEIPIRSDTNERYLAQWQALVRRPLAGIAYRRAIRALEPRVARFGYSLSDTTASGPRPALERAWVP